MLATGSGADLRALRRSHRMSLRELGRLAEQVRVHSAHLVELDTAYGADDLWRVGVRAFRTARRQFTDGHEPGRELAAAAGEAGEVAAWLLHDAGQPESSKLVMVEALELSRIAGDRDMELMGLGHLAMLAVGARRTGEALRIARDVTESGGLSPRVRALFGLRHARALAQAGDRRRSLAAIGAARATLTTYSRGPTWSWWLDESELHWHEATVRAELGDWNRAVDGFRAALATRNQCRASHNDRAHLVAALVRVRAWSEAEDVLLDLVQESAVVGSARTTELLRLVLVRIAASSPPSGVAGSAELLAGALDRRAS